MGGGAESRCRNAFCFDTLLICSTQIQTGLKPDFCSDSNSSVNNNPANQKWKNVLVCLELKLFMCLERTESPADVSTFVSNMFSNEQT